jgi:uncharacterized membrane protein YkvA (DUF1232 family)
MNTAKYFSERSFKNKIKKYAVLAGKKLTEPVLAMYYCMRDTNTPVKVKLSIVAALGYFILPTDLIFDLTPFIGFTDDLTVILTTYGLIRKYVTRDHLQKAENFQKKFI